MAKDKWIPPDPKRPYTSPTPGYKKIPKGQSFRTDQTDLNPLLYRSTRKPGQPAPEKKVCLECGAENHVAYTVCFHCNAYFDE